MNNILPILKSAALIIGASFLVIATMQLTKNLLPEPPLKVVHHVCVERDGETTCKSIDIDLLERAREIRRKE